MVQFPSKPILTVRFFRTAAGTEPVREWLRTLPREDRKTIGTDIKTAQFGWPLGMPLVRKLGPNLWEVRSRLNRRIARVLFTAVNQEMILLHGFLKKSQKTPGEDFDLANARLKLIGD
jgi:phage-related protein